VILDHVSQPIYATIFAGSSNIAQSPVVGSWNVDLEFLLFVREGEAEKRLQPFEAEYLLRNLMDRHGLQDWRCDVVGGLLEGMETKAT
jgi:hypothetical protein